MKKITFTLLTVFCLLSGVSAQFTKLTQAYPGIDLNDIYARGSRIIAVGTLVDFSGGIFQGHIFISNNGGGSWDTLQISPRGFFFKTIDFKDADTGFIGGYGNISIGLRSTDGGSTWAYYWQDMGNSGVTDIHFLNEKLGFACGYGTSQFSNGNVYKTTDGAQTWMSQADSMNGLPLDAMQMVNEQYGYAWGGTFGAKKMVRTIDSGATWQYFYTHPNVPGGVYWWNKDEGILADNTGKIFKTANGGNSWTPRPSGTTQELSSVTFLDRHTGFVVGVDGLILKTTDGGETWHQQSSPTSEVLTKVEIHENRAYILGFNGTILRSELLTGLNEAAAGTDEVSIYPNPASNELFVSLGTSGNNRFEAKLLDLQGRVIKTISSAGNELHINLAEVPDGLYLVGISSGNGQVTKKVLIQH